MGTLFNKKKSNWKSSLDKKKKADCLILNSGFQFAPERARVFFCFSLNYACRPTTVSTGRGRCTR